MPLVVGQLLDEMANLVGARLYAALTIPELAGLGPEPAAKAALGIIHVPVRIGLMHGEGTESLGGTHLGDLAGIADGSFELAAEWCGKRGHGENYEG